uniref:Uncharacterized protein n=1 Tax=Glossina austeni TaxID=7395 RepID=A0A1A9UZG5_GLOAU
MGLREITSIASSHQMFYSSAKPFCWERWLPTLEKPNVNVILRWHTYNYKTRDSYFLYNVKGVYKSATKLIQYSFNVYARSRELDWFQSRLPDIAFVVCLLKCMLHNLNIRANESKEDLKSVKYCKAGSRWPHFASPTRNFLVQANRRRPKKE